ncbi:hypothetical protein DFA_10385 [Cavenderia fasciculata]|uniref:Major facilitator superfamily (MFS) profile domain-containing protein n=1 Tax=Cavenderia fasciculata TaxID=261658 RepID=F4QA24_CACFS|nr:uncharacterized protein DFA_10385 [Cavenderia fasciculata]EGG15543.1 hypothetical protein DFA_10385 [Cavenderia fasciculata]|eukprot:XP_004354285.1 hypothetical protein DFA_10385 [Cavenderia fasciculata]
MDNYQNKSSYDKFETKEADLLLPIKDEAIVKESLLREKIGMLLCLVLFLLQAYAQTSFTAWLMEEYALHNYPNSSQSQRDSTASHYQSISDALPFASSFIACPLIGMVADRKGRKILCMFVLFTALCDSIITIVGVKFWLLWPIYMSNFFGGISLAIAPLVFAYFADITTKEERPSIYALIGMSQGISACLGPLIGMGLMAWLPIYTQYFSCACLVLAMAVLIPLKESYHFREGIRISRDDEPVAPEDAAANGSRNPFVAVASLFKVGKFVGLYSLVAFIYCFSYIDSLTTQYNFTNVKFNWGPTPNNILSSAVGVGVFVWSIILNWILKSKSERSVTMFAFLGVSACHLLYAFSQNQWMYAVFLCVGSFTTLIFNNIQSTISKAVPNDMQATVLAGVSSLGSLSTFAGALTMENLLAYFISGKAPIYFPGMNYILDSGVMFLAFLLSLALLFIYPRGCKEELGEPLKDDNKVIDEEQEDLIKDNNNNNGEISNYNSINDDDDHNPTDIYRS